MAMHQYNTTSIIANDCLLSDNNFGELLHKFVLQTMKQKLWLGLLGVDGLARIDSDTLPMHRVSNCTLK